MNYIAFNTLEGNFPELQGYKRLPSISQTFFKDLQLIKYIV